MKSIEDIIMELYTESAKLSESKIFKEAGDFGKAMLFHALVKSKSDEIRGQLQGHQAPKQD